MEINTLLETAKKYIPEPDYIVNAYDMMIVWVSPKALEVTGYGFDEITKMQNLDLASPQERAITHNEIMSRVLQGKGEYNFKMITKGGQKINFFAQYIVFEFENEPYVIGKLLSNDSNKKSNV